MQLQELYNIGKQKLRDHSIDTPGLEAYLLLSKSELLDNMVDVYSKGQKEIHRHDVEKFHNLLERRINREPTAYILGRKEFYSRSFEVNPSVLIPRGETELLVDETVNIVNQTSSEMILEIGTGSGCVAVTLACLCDDVTIVATDISNDAIKVAKKNCIEHGKSNRISFLRTDLSSSLKSRSFDVVVSNPPYIREEDYMDLEPEVRDYEPKVSLLSPSDGLYHIEKIISDSKRVLKEGGSCVLEIGYSQKEAVANIFEGYGFKYVSFAKDINGIERVVKAKMEKILVEGGNRLEGEVVVSGAKNAVLPLMAACILAEGKNTITNVPDLADVRTMIQLLGILGAEVEFDNGRLVIDSTNMDTWEAPYDLVKTMRASVLVLGPLTARFGRSRVSLPGGVRLVRDRLINTLKDFPYSVQR